MPFTYPYPRPAVTVDVVLFAMRAGELAVLLIQRAHEPFQGAWALPGGFVDENESLEKAALRELAEETGIAGVAIEQLGAFGDPGRDPRGHTVSVAYLGVAGPGAPAAQAGDDAAAAVWQPLHVLQGRGRKAVALAFDHRAILALARARLLAALRDPLHDPMARALVPPRFTLKELKHVHDAVLGAPVPEAELRAHLREDRLVERVAGSGAARGPRGPSGKRAGAGAPLYRWRRAAPRSARRRAPAR